MNKDAQGRRKVERSESNWKCGLKSIHRQRRLCSPRCVKRWSSIAVLTRGINEKARIWGSGPIIADYGLAEQRLQFQGMLGLRGSRRVRYGKLRGMREVRFWKWCDWLRQRPQVSAKRPPSHALRDLRKARRRAAKAVRCGPPQALGACFDRQLVRSGLRMTTRVRVPLQPESHKGEAEWRCDRRLPDV